ncbi:MAG: hypothetical protein JWN38_771 [Candidatus Saccharibacteria bacterium]|nr:hypothetical protein [Candidatus Saccharibacteria bacterium]
MFGRRERIEALEAQLADAQDEIETIKGDPIYQVFQETRDQVQQMFGDPTESVQGIIAKAVTARQEEYMAERIDDLADERAKSLIKTEKKRIDAELQPEVELAAKKILENFMTNEADGYRAQRLAELTKTGSKLIVKEACKQLEAEAKQELVEAEKVKQAEKMRAKEAREQERKALKARAGAILKETATTQRLPLSRLQPNDEFTIYFAKQGNGQLPPSSKIHYSGTFLRPTLERTITFTVTDPAAGTAVVKLDSWLGQPNKHELAIRGGRKVSLSAIDNGEKELGYLPMVVKGEQLTIKDETGKKLPGGNLDVWWGSLDTYQILA